MFWKKKEQDAAANAPAKPQAVEKLVIGERFFAEHQQPEEQPWVIYELRAIADPKSDVGKVFAVSSRENATDLVKALDAITLDKITVAP